MAGSPEWREMIEKTKDAIFAETGIRPDFILDIGSGDMPGDSEENETPPRGDERALDSEEGAS